jgi:NAD/NADP transhydrogenase beta subunit
MTKTKWMRLILAGYASLLLVGLAAFATLGVLEPLAMHWTVVEVAIALGLGLMIALALGGGDKPRRLSDPQR